MGSLFWRQKLKAQEWELEKKLRGEEGRKGSLGLSV
jgi:hypothetical protein